MVSRAQEGTGCCRTRPPRTTARPRGPAPDRRPDGRAALGADLRAALPDAGAAVAVTAAVFALLYARMASGDSATVAVMPFMDDPGTYWMYLLSQAFGWSGLLWAWGTVMLGLLLSGPRPARLPPPPAPRTLAPHHEPDRDGP